MDIMVDIKEPRNKVSGIKTERKIPHDANGIPIGTPWEVICEKMYDNSYPEVVAYTVQGNHLTQDQYLQEINIALRQIEQGKTIADEDLQKEIEAW